MSTSAAQFVEVLYRNPRRVFHRVPIRVGGRVIIAWLLKRFAFSITPASVHRDVLYVEDPRRLLGELPPSIRSTYDHFAAEINALKRSRNSATAAMKEAVRRLADATSFSGLNVVPVAYRFGVVPALIVQEAIPYSIALASPLSEYNVRSKETVASDAIEILRSHSAHLSLLIHAYLEQIGFYFRAIFFNARDHDVIHYCLRIRQIAGESLKGKLEFIEDSRAHSDPSVALLAEQIHEDNSDLIQTAYQAYDVALLLVNYIYRFYCIDDRVSLYQDRIRAQADGQDIFAYPDETQAFLAQAAANAERLTPTFLRLLGRNRPIRPDDWQQVFGEAAAFIGEINNLATGKFDRLRGFLSYHFDVTSSELFFEKLNRLVGDEQGFQLIRGRKLDESIRWSLLSLIWLADIHMLFVPNSWQRVDGTIRQFAKSRDWAMLELMYGHHLGRTRENFVAAPDPQSERRRLIDQISSYNTEREIEELPEEGWEQNVEKIKREILDGLSDTRYIPVHLGADDAILLGVFNERIFQPAVRKFAQSLAEAFSYWFDTDESRSVRALACLCRDAKTNDAQFTAKQVLKQRILNKDCVYIKGIRTDDQSAENKVRDHLDKGADEFSFRLDRATIPMITAVRRQGKATLFTIDHRPLFEELRKRFGDRANDVCEKDFVEIICRRRKD